VKHLAVLWLVVLALLLLRATNAAAQWRAVGALSGTVVDASTKKPLADVVVTARSPALQGEQVVLTSAAGFFQIPGLPVGSYSLAFEKDGYKRSERDDVAVYANVTYRVNAELLPETIAAEVVTVQSAPPTIDVGSSSVSTTITSDTTARVPVAAPSNRGSVNRSFESVASVTPRRDVYGVSIARAPAPENGYAVNAFSGGRPGSHLAGRRGAPSTLADVPHSAGMLIYTASFAMGVFQVTESMDAVERIAHAVGGYLGVRDDDVIVIRVPRDRFEEAVTGVEKLGNILHRDIKAEDVTDQVVDLEARLKNAYVMRDRLTELLGKATVTEALSIEKELGRVTEQIELMEGKLKLIRDQLAFSTISVQFAPISKEEVHDTSLLTPFPWLRGLGLQPLLALPQ
jgi:hypothetical protein